MAGPLTHRVPPELDGQRADKAVAALAGLSRSASRGLFEIGVTVDGEPVQPSDRVATGATIVIPAEAPHRGLVPEAVEFGILYEDESLVVVDKPPGLVVHPGAGSPGGTLAAGLLQRYPGLEGIGDPGRWGLVHRLDRDTSGALIVALTDEAYRGLKADLTARRIGRIYRVLVHGALPAATGTIDAPIGRDPARPTRRAAVVGGKPARTHYEALESLGAFTLADARLETGRTHQIRVHFALIGHPVAGDRVYSELPPPTGLPRIFLHARRVDFRHPVTDEPLSVESPLPADLTAALAALRKAAG